jgi:hypothetical protein
MGKALLVLYILAAIVFIGNIIGLAFGLEASVVQVTGGFAALCQLIVLYKTKGRLKDENKDL